MKNTGDGRRKTRVEREVQQVISNFIISHMRSDVPGVVTVTRLQMPADFRAAQVFVTYYDPNPGDKKMNIASLLQSWASDIQDEIAHKLKMRYCPKLTFFEDEMTHKILKIEKILSNIQPNQNVDEIDIDDLDDDDEENN